MDLAKSVALTEKAISVIHAEMRQPLANVIRQVNSSSKRIYVLGAKYFDEWLRNQGRTIENIDRAGMISYKEHLTQKYAKATAARMWSITRQLLLECQHSGNRRDYPMANIKGFTLENESPHIALTHRQVKEILENIDRSTMKGKRDYALFFLLVRTGIRRKECEQINIGDFFEEQGYTMLTIQHGKGDKRRKVKIPIDVLRSIREYVEATGRTFTSLSDPLFVGFDRGQHPTNTRISDRTIERIVIGCGQLIGIEHLTPHDLRTTFNTLAKS